MMKGAISSRKTRTGSKTMMEISDIASVIHAGPVSMRSQDAIHLFHALKCMDERFAGTIMTVVIALPGEALREDFLNVRVSNFVYTLLVICSCF